jgi:hypothetical protein
MALSRRQVGAISAIDRLLRLDRVIECYRSEREAIDSFA